MEAEQWTQYSQENRPQTPGVLTVLVNLWLAGRRQPTKYSVIIILFATQHYTGYVHVPQTPAKMSKS